MWKRFRGWLAGVHLSDPVERQPAPLSETTRRFLRPLVGIDPADARVHRGAEAGEATARMAADGMTVGDDVLLGAAHEDESAPETLGLLAHELTHVARQREPRFVPPVVRQASSESASEETLARAVEARTIQAASAAQSRPPA